MIGHKTATATTLSSPFTDFLKGLRPLKDHNNHGVDLEKHTSLGPLGPWRIVLVNLTLREEMTKLPRGVHLKKKEDSLEMTVERETVLPLNEPITLLYFTSEELHRHLATFRLAIEVAPHGQISVFEKHVHLGPSKDDYGIKHVTDITVQGNACLEHVKSLQGNERALQLAQVRATVKRDARLSSFAHILGGKLTHYDVAIDLSAPGAKAEITGLYSLSGDQYGESVSVVHHRASHTFSGQFFKGILDDRAHGLFTGDIDIHPKAQHVEANQLNKNLLLSKKAHALTRPQLNVAAHDVKCSHGATVGELAEEETFYLQSRGVGKKRARHILLKAFADEALERISSPIVRRHLAVTEGDF